MISLLRPTEWVSKSTLREHLDASVTPSLLLGEDAEAPRKFYSFNITVDSLTCEVGVVSSGHGITPQALVFWDGSLAIVGHDKEITWVDLQSARVKAECLLDGVFYEFVPLSGRDTLVLHELGVLRVDAAGTVAWRVDTDLVESARLDIHGDLLLTLFEGGSRLRIDIRTGNVLS